VRRPQVLAIAWTLIVALTARAHAADVRISPNLNWNGESNLVVDPTDASRWVVGWMSSVGGRAALATSRSTDGGVTWSTPLYLPHTGTGHTSADPTFLWRRNGTVIACYVDFDAVAFASGGLYTCRSSNGGASWDAPVLAASVATPDRPVDRPWIACDESTGPHAGRLYLASKKQNDAVRPYRIYLMTSDDDGRTWSAQRTIDDLIPAGANLKSMAVPTVGPTGKLWIGYLSFDTAYSPFPRYIVETSTDGGATFVPHVAAVLPLSAMGVSTDSLYQYSYVLAASPRDPGRAILAWTDRRNGDPDIMATMTSDGGATWSAPTRVNDDVAGNGVGQDMLWGAWAQDGTYAIAWRDRRNAGAGQSAAFRVYASRSIDGGVTFQPNVPVSASASPAITFVDGNDFLGVALTSNALVCTWADARVSPLGLQLYAARLSLTPIVTDVPVARQDLLHVRALACPSASPLAVEVRGAGDQPIELGLWDVEGRQVARTTIVGSGAAPVRAELARDALAGGVYLVSARSQGRTAVAKVVVLR